MLHGNNLDLNRAQLLNAAVQNLASFPTALNSVKGQMAFRTSDNRFGVFNGTYWLQVIDDYVYDVSGVAGDTPIHFEYYQGGVNTGPKYYLLDLLLPDGYFYVGAGGYARPLAKTSIPISGFGAALAAVNFGGQRLTNVGDPTDPADAAPKSYVDARVGSGVNKKDPCRAATTAALPAHTFAANVMTASANGAFPAQDGVTLGLNERLLVNKEGGGIHLENGIYYLSQVGDGSNPWKLTRALDADTSAEVTSGMFTLVTEGTTLAGTGWTLQTPDPITLNTTALKFIQTDAPALVLPGNGMTKSGNTLHFGQTAAYTANRIPYTSGATTIGFLAGTAHQVLRMDGSGIPGFGAIALNQAAAISGTLPISNGGTGATTAAAAFTALSPLTTKGDLLVHNGTSSVRFAVGADGTVPFADATQATGIRWGALPTLAPTDATYLVTSLNATLTHERALANGAGISFLDNGAGSTFTVSVNQAWTPTWSALHTWDNGTVATAGTTLLAFGRAALTSAGISWSHALAFKAATHDGTAHTLEWRLQAVPTVYSGASSFFYFNVKLDSGGSQSVFGINSNGTAWLAGLTPDRIVLTDAGKNLVSSTYSLPASIVSHQILYAGHAGAVVGLDPVPLKVLTSDASGAPIWSSNLPDGTTIAGSRAARVVTKTVPVGTTSIVLDHFLNTWNIIVMLRNANGEYMMTDYRASGTPSVVLSFARPTTEELTAVIQG